MLEPEGARSTGEVKWIGLNLVTSQHDVQDKFSKDMFGTDQVTVTVEYEGDDPNASQEEEKQKLEQEQEQQEQPEVDDETLLNNDESKPDEKEQELDEEEKAVLESVT